MEREIFFKNFIKYLLISNKKKKRKSKKIEYYIT